MKKLGLNEIREKFKNFYVEKGHYPAPSASLIPKNDKSLLIINSGMAPLKAYFLGQENPPAKRMTTCQKCIRTGDIENVGITSRHGTFFEMLGNFSFGDYFKKESLAWGWEFLTQVMEMPADRLWATVYKEDNEAFEIWKDLGMKEDHIVRLGKEDNFWEIGLGPCGPDSEIFFDRGEEYKCSDPDCKPGCDCDRFIEVWNHVFSQFSKEEDGSYSNLEHPNIDTGMGLERMACLIQGVDSIFDIDTIRYILDGVAEASGIKYNDGNQKADISMRIITDHLRSMVFMIADTITPSNEGRGYVLRRLIRRAARHGRMIGIPESFLSGLSDRVIEISGDAYPELIEKKEYIKKIISGEERQFLATLSQGESIIEEYISTLKKEGKDLLDGEKAFKLYDTYGFPLELTEEILQENGIKTDTDGFASAMKIQKETARQGRKDIQDAAWSDESPELNIPETDFEGYANFAGESKVLAIVSEGKSVKKAVSNEKVAIYLDKTPFYAEGGGQVSDKGFMYNNSVKIFVESVSKSKGLYKHIAVIEEGNLSLGDTLITEIDSIKRNKTARNHTATHLLQASLRKVLGGHVQQAGSLVNEKELRFDFNHFEAMTAGQIEDVQNIVNEEINKFIRISTCETSIKEAEKMGAIALFGEKYGENVRVVSCGDFSVELCGGTHVSNTGQIGSFKIVSESGVASGVRRIIAITGTSVLEEDIEREKTITEVSDLLKAKSNQVISRTKSIIEENKLLKKEIEELKKASIGSEINEIACTAENIGKVKLITKEFSDYNIKDLRDISDEIKTKVSQVIMVFATSSGGKATLLVSVSDDLLDKGYHAGKIIKELAKHIGGGGGGKADMAQAGGKNPDGISKAFEVAKELLS